MPAAPIILGAAVAAGISTTIGTAIIGAITTATISASVATAIGTGVIAGGITAIQGGDSSDILKSAVLSGAGSYIGSQVASKVTSAVAAETGASLIDLEPALRGLSGEGITAGGAAAITAGNVAGQAVNAAITGRPIGEGALLGLATSIPTALAASQDFQSLDRVAQNVIASSLQASALGSDVGTAAIASLVTSSDIVAKAIKQIPNGEEFIKQNPIFAKYIVDSVSSALVAKLAGADVSESVIASLARTTGDVLAREFQNAQNSNAVTEARQKNDEASRLQEQATAARDELTQLLATNKKDIDLFNAYLDIYSKEKPEFDRLKRRFNSLSSQYDRLSTDQEWRDYINQLSSRQGLSPEQYIASEANSLENEIVSRVSDLNNTVKILNSQTEKLQAANFFDTYDRLVNDIKAYDSQYTALVNDITRLADNLGSTSAGLFNDFSTELETTLAPLTAFQNETVPDQDILAEIQPVAPPDELLAGGDTGQLPVEDQELLNQIQDVAQRPDIGTPTGGAEVAEAPTGGGLAIDITIKPNIYDSEDGRTVINGVGVLFEDGQLIRKLTPEEIKQISGIDVAYAPEEIANYLDQFGITKNAPVNAVYVDPNGAFYVGEDLNVYDVRNERIASMNVAEFQSLTGQTPNEAVRVNPDTLLRTNDGKLLQTARPTAELKPVDTGATGAPPVDYSLGATDMQGTQPTQQPPSPTIGLNLLTAGTGIEGGRNRALFNTGGGLGSGGNTTETTYSLVARASETVPNDIVDVGGKLYALILLPDRQVLVPEIQPVEPVYIELIQDPTTNLPVMQEKKISQAPSEIALQVAEKAGEVAGNAVAQAEETPITSTLPGGAGESTVVGGETPTTVVGGEAETTVTGGEAPTTVDTITGGDVAETGQASVPGGEISDEEIINIIVGEGNVPPSSELPATTVVGGEEAPTTVVGGEDTTPGGLPEETITGEAGADTVVGGGDQVVEIAPTVPGGEQITPTIPGGEEITPTIPGGEGEISDEDLINIIIGEGTPTTAGGGGEDTVVGGEEVPTVPGGEQVLPTIPGGDVTDILQPTLPGGAGEGDTVVSGGGEADTILGGGGEGEATLPGGEGEDTIGGGLGDGEITDQDIINIITGGDTGVGGGGEDTTPAGGGEDEVAPTIPGGDDEAILDLIRDLEQEEGMEEIPLEPETPVEEVTPPTTGTRPVVTVVPRQRGFQRPGEAAPYRVTGQDESGILGRKQPLFGGDEDLQRAEWNRRSLRLKRLLGL